MTHLLALRCRTIARARRHDGGFMLVEAIVAMGILAVVVLATEFGLLGSFASTTVAKEHDVASNLASSAIDQAQALPFTDVQAGLNSTADDLASDPQISSSVSGGQTSYTLSLNGATIPATNTNTLEAPLVPHLTHVTDGGVAYQVAMYPTVAASSPGLVTLVAIVTWTSATGASEQLVAQSGVSAP